MIDYSLNLRMICGAGRKYVPTSLLSHLVCYRMASNALLWPFAKQFMIIFKGTTPLSGFSSLRIGIHFHETTALCSFIEHPLQLSSSGIKSRRFSNIKCTCSFCSFIASIWQPLHPVISCPLALPSGAVFNTTSSSIHTYSCIVLPKGSIRPQNLVRVSLLINEQGMPFESTTSLCCPIRYLLECCDCQWVYSS